MIIPSLITIFQYFAPGLIILIFTRLRFNIVQKVVLSFTLSQIVNFVLVFSLTYFKYYNLENLYIAVGAEVLILAYCYFKNILFDNVSFNDRYKNLEQIASKPFGKLSIMLSAFSLLLVIILMANKAGAIFDGWDPVFSWNRWAVSFFNNSLPQGMMHYPQLIPANWSVAYVFLSKPLQFLPKLIMPIYLLFILISLFDIALIEKSAGVMFGLIITLYIFISARVSFEGYVDTPVAFFVFQSLYLLFLSNKENNGKNGTTYLILGGAVAAGAAVTKQAGLFLVVLYPILSWVMVVNKRKIFTQNQKITMLATYVLFIVIIIAPFYVYANQQISTGHSVSEIKWVTNGIYGNKGMGQRFVDAVALLNTLVRVPYLICILVPIFIYSLKEKKIRAISFLVTIPFFFIWAFYFSYDLRNLSIVYPLIALNLGIGIYNICKIVAVKIPSKKIEYFFASVSVFGIVFFARQADKKYAITYYEAVQTKLEKQICLPRLNELLYNYECHNGIHGNIASDYPILDYLPELKNYAVPYTLNSVSNNNVAFALIRDNDYNKGVINKLISESKVSKVSLIFYYSDINDYKYYFFKLR